MIGCANRTPTPGWIRGGVTSIVRMFHGARVGARVSSYEFGGVPGRMSEACRANDTNLARDVALKASGLPPRIERRGGAGEQVAAVGRAVAPLEQVRIHHFGLGITGAFVLYKQLFEDVHLELTRRLIEA